MTSLKPTREPLSEQAFRWLLDKIQAGHWAVGTRLPAEAQLSVQMGVCRSTLREAVRGLIHAGILEVRHGSGTYVVSTTGIEAALKRRLDVATALEIVEVRRALEVQAAGLAAARRTPEEADALEALLARLHEAVERRDIDAVIALDLAFLRAMLGLTRNTLLIDLHRDLEVALQALFQETMACEPFETMLRDLHAPLMAAIRQGDAQGAETAARTHLDRVLAILEAGGVL